MALMFWSRPGICVAPPGWRHAAGFPCSLRVQAVFAVVGQLLVQLLGVLLALYQLHLHPPFLLTIKEGECFLNELPDGFDPSNISSVKGPSGKVVKKHLIQNTTESIQVTIDKV